ncbi:MAG: DsrE/DsrF/DrsH-like family protein [Chloroflexi bacterium]|nr:DsrE/DsrF/DrsH-like family protein [Chloroflexota bacterium]
METDSNKLSMIVFSGDMDKVMAAYVVATGAAASGMDVTMFFTFWGLKAIQDGSSTGSSLFGKMLGLMNRGGIDRIGPSRLNMGGMGRWMFKKMMKAHNVASLRDLQSMAADLGVKTMACQMSMDVMEIARTSLIPAVSDVAGVAAFIEEASKSKATLFI